MQQIFLCLKKIKACESFGSVNTFCHSSLKSKAFYHSYTENHGSLPMQASEDQCLISDPKPRAQRICTMRWVTLKLLRIICGLSSEQLSDWGTAGNSLLQDS